LKKFREKFINSTIASPFARHIPPNIRSSTEYGSLPELAAPIHIQECQYWLKSELSRSPRRTRTASSPLHSLPLDAPPPDTCIGQNPRKMSKIEMFATESTYRNSKRVWPSLNSVLKRSRVPSVQQDHSGVPCEARELFVSFLMADSMCSQTSSGGSTMGSN
jgi:hypothetical protein